MFVGFLKIDVIEVLKNAMHSGRSPYLRICAIDQNALHLPKPR